MQGITEQLGCSAATIRFLPGKYKADGNHNHLQS
jgi:hypothetical protein